MRWSVWEHITISPVVWHISECWYDVYIQKVKVAAGVRQIPGRSYNTISGMSHTRWGWSLFLSHPILRKIADKPRTIMQILWFQDHEDDSVSANALSAQASVARGRSHWKEPGALQSSLSLTITLTFWTCDIETDYHMRISIPWHLHPNKPWQ